MRTLVLLLSLLPPLAGCESIFGPGNDRPDPLTELPRPLTAAEQAVIGASNRFAFDLLREVVARDTSSNVVLSPLSASMALGMTMNGAEGETFSGMRSALGFGTLEPEQINQSYRDLIDLLLGLDAGVDMRIANSIWVRTGFPLHDAFVQSSGASFDAEITPLDFSDAAAPGVINGWVERKTNGKIDRIVERIDPDVVMYLINAIYFKGSWTSRFDRSRTQPAVFRRADGTEQTVRMMHLPEGRVRSAFTPEAQLVELPYGREAFSLVLVLPREDRPLGELVASLDQERWNAWTGQLRDGSMDVFLPRFRVEYERVLNGTLQALGMQTAFDPDAADFGRMSPVGDDLYISNVKQKTFLDVNEEGTEAAAVTSVEIRVTSAPPAFRADRPFLLALRERLSGTILFLGVIGAPESE